MEIKEFNLVNETLSVAPSYEINPLERTIRFFFDENKIIILGQADQKYVYWFSITDIENTEINNEIFKLASTLDCSIVTTLDLVLSQTVYSEETLHYLYTDKLYVNRNDISLWNSPFETLYDKDSLFGDDVLSYYQNKKNLANQDDPALKNRLNDYLIRTFTRSENPEDDYAKYYQIIKNTQQASYLLLSDDELLKTTYIELKKNCTEIVQKYKKTLN